MAWDDLSPEQQDIVATYVRQIRATAGQLARLLNVMSASNSMYTGQVQDAWALLLAEDVILDGSGLAGVSQLSKAEVTTIANAVQNILTTYNSATNRELYVKMAGMTNTT